MCNLHEEGEGGRSRGKEKKKGAQRDVHCGSLPRQRGKELVEGRLSAVGAEIEKKKGEPGKAGEKKSVFMNHRNF